MTIDSLIAEFCQKHQNLIHHSLTLHTAIKYCIMKGIVCPLYGGCICIERHLNRNSFITVGCIDCIYYYENVCVKDANRMKEWIELVEIVKVEMSLGLEFDEEYC